MEKSPNGNKVLSDWCQEVVHGANMTGSVVRSKNQLSIHIVMVKNLIPDERGLNKR